jgi:hypothetical protein
VYHKDITELQKQVEYIIEKRAPIYTIKMMCMDSQCNKKVFREQLCTVHYTKHNTEEDFVLQHCLEIDRCMQLANSSPDKIPQIKRSFTSLKENHSKIHEKWCLECMPMMDKWLENN